MKRYNEATKLERIHPIHVKMLMPYIDEEMRGVAWNARSRMTFYFKIAGTDNDYVGWSKANGHQYVFNHSEDNKVWYKVCGPERNKPKESE